VCGKEVVNSFFIPPILGPFSNDLNDGCRVLGEDMTVEKSQERRLAATGCSSNLKRSFQTTDDKERTWVT
jgi:hypothetical protein